MDNGTTAQDASCLPEPLTRTSADGEAYQRHTVVDSQIREALRLYPEELRKRAEIRDDASPDFIKEEALVYLIRHYHKTENRQCVDDLSECLLTRCASLVNNNLSSLGSAWQEDASSEVFADLFGMILDLDSDRGDFLQVRFWVVLKRITVDVFRKMMRVEQSTIPLDSLTGYDGEAVATAEVEVPAPSMHVTGSVETEVIDRILIRDALSQLDEPIRSAFLLRHYAGWPIEDQDPSARTISKHFGRTPRTISNWLVSAEESLEAWREAQK